MRRRTGRGALLANSAPPIISLIMLNYTPTVEGQRIIQWHTNIPSTSQVAYGLTSALGSLTILDPTLVKSHTVTISGLTPGATYFFQVISKSASGVTSKSTIQTFVASQFQIITGTAIAGSSIPQALPATYSANTVDANNFAIPTQNQFVVECQPAATIPDPNFCLFYMAFSSPNGGGGINNGTDYYAWYNIDGMYTDPGNPFGSFAISIEVLINSSDDESAVAAATISALVANGIDAFSVGGGDLLINMTYGNNSNDNIINFTSVFNIFQTQTGSDPSWFYYKDPVYGIFAVIMIVDGLGSSQYFENIAQQIGDDLQILVYNTSSDDANTVALNLQTAFVNNGNNVVSVSGNLIIWNALNGGSGAYIFDGNQPTFFGLDVDADGTFSPYFLFYDPSFSPNAAPIEVVVWSTTSQAFYFDPNAAHITEATFSTSDSATTVATEIANAISGWVTTHSGANFTVKCNWSGAAHAPIDGPTWPIGHGFSISITTPGKP